MDTIKFCVEKVLKCLNDEDIDVRAHACRGFGPTRSDIPLEEVLKRLNDEDAAASQAFGPTRIKKCPNDENPDVWAVAGMSSYSNNSVERHASICRELNKLYGKKNHDYGDSFHQTWVDEGYAMARIRLSDKINRFRTLTLKDSERDMASVQDESIRDTLLDLANYAIMTIMELDFEKIDRNPKIYGGKSNVQ